MKLLDLLTEALNKQQIVYMAKEFMNSESYNSNHDCKRSTFEFIKWAKKNKGFEPDALLLAPPKDIKKFPGKSGDGDSHIFAIVDGFGVDFTTNQFPGISEPLKITPESQIPSEYKKIGGYYTDFPDWFENGKTAIKRKFNNLPQWFHDGFEKEGFKPELNEMIKLLDLLIEAKNKTNKAIIMAGAAGAGKSTIVKQLRPDLQKSIVNKIRPDIRRNNWLELNADNYVEDKNSPMYNNLAKASNYIEKTDLPNAISSGENFLYDTTASNVDRIKKVVNSVGEAMMIMVYTNPIVSFLRNFKRERRVPTIGVLSSWNNVYKNISTYSDIFGDNFILVVSEISPVEQKMIEEFEKAFRSNKLKEFFEELLSSGQFKSSFKKDPTKEKTPEELAKSKALLDKQIDILSSQFSDIEKQVELLKSDSVESAVSKAKSFINS